MAHNPEEFTNENVRFWFGATLRIMDVPESHSLITEAMGAPTHAHIVGEANPDRPGEVWKNSIWFVDSPCPEGQDIGVHLDWVMAYARPHREFLTELIRGGARVDVFLSYCCNEDHRGFRLDPHHMAFFSSLQMPFEISVLT